MALNTNIINQLKRAEVKHQLIVAMIRHLRSSDNDLSRDKDKLRHEISVCDIMIYVADVYKDCPN